MRASGALAAGDTDKAAALLGVAVRIGPHLAPRIVDATMETDVPALLLVRGDALRATGHDADATAAYAAAAAALGAELPPEATTGAAVPEADVPEAAGEPELADAAGTPAVDDAPDADVTPDGDAAVPYGPTGSTPQ